MQNQVDLHQWLLTALDSHLIPTARNHDLRSLLETQPASVAAHLEQVRAIRGRLWDVSTCRKALASDLL